MMNESLSRLIDLRLNWLAQYAPETTLFEPGFYGEIGARLNRLEGYLGETAAVVAVCDRKGEEWGSWEDPWAGLLELVARAEAEFSGRLLMGAEDFGRWEEESEGLTWAVLGVGGVERWVRSAGELERLSALVERGVRVVALGESGWNREVLRALGEAAEGRCGVGVDLPGENGALVDEVLGWLEEDEGRAERVIPVVRGVLPDRLGEERLRRLRALGGVLGVPVGGEGVGSVEALRRGIAMAAEVPFRGREGFEGIGVATDYLGVEEVLPELGTAEGVCRWLRGVFPEAAEGLIGGNARVVIERLVGSGRGSI